MFHIKVEVSSTAAGTVDNKFLAEFHGTREELDSAVSFLQLAAKAQGVSGSGAVTTAVAALVEASKKL